MTKGRLISVEEETFRLINIEYAEALALNSNVVVMGFDLDEAETTLNALFLFIKKVAPANSDAIPLF